MTPLNFFDPLKIATPGLASPMPGLLQPPFPRLGLGFPGMPSPQLIVPVQSRTADMAMRAKVTAFVNACASREPRPDAKKRTHFIFLLDGSRSMLVGKALTIAGFNQQVELVKGAGGAGEVTVTLLVFSHVIKKLLQYAPASALEPLTSETYQPDGGTALFDAMGAALEVIVGAPGATDADTAFFLAVLTDGEERDSKLLSGLATSQCIRKMEETGRLTVTLMGPEEQAMGLADMLAISRGNVGKFNPQSVDSRGESFASMSGATSSYLAGRASGALRSANLYAAPADPR